MLLDSGIAVPAHPLEFSPTENREGTVVDCRSAERGRFPAEVNGNVALVARGDETPRDKADAAMRAGAKAMILVNTTADEMPFRGTSDLERTLAGRGERYAKRRRSDPGSHG